MSSSNPHNNLIKLHGLAVSAESSRAGVSKGQKTG